MDMIKLSVLERTETGDGPSRRLRASGRIPGVVYAKGTEATSVSIDLDSLREAMTHGHNVVMELDFSGGAKPAKKGAKSKAGARYAVVKELQFHPTRRGLLHVDLHEVDLKVEIEAPVAIELVGTPAGVADGGIVDWEHREVTVRALPSDIPVALPLDVTDLLIGHHLNVAALTAPSGVTIVDDPDTIVVALIPPRVQEEVTEVAEAEEPEVIGGAKTEE
ncbi:MAG TPA: 50S ribosomal protein L25 [Thermoleophilia bacterium]|nr:50S ribosomal protein L25 [Thermoleophilia bacterium]